MKATVYRISGAVLSCNYIQFPKATSQSLGLTGRFLYLLFRPLPTKYFSIHLELATDAGLAVRVSLSNLYKEFKSTSTWLQFPFSLLDSETEETGTTQGEENGKRCGTVKSSQMQHHWTLLVLDLRAALTQHLNANFAYVKNIKLCANILVKGVFTSNTEYSPLAGDVGGVQVSGGTQPLPREMCLPLGKSEDFTQVYNFVRFPSESRLRHRIGCVHPETQKKRVRGRSTVECVSVNGEGGDGVRGRSSNESRGKSSRTKVRVFSTA